MGGRVGGENGPAGWPIEDGRDCLEGGGTCVELADGYFGIKQGGRKRTERISMEDGSLEEGTHPEDGPSWIGGIIPRGDTYCRSQ